MALLSALAVEWAGPYLAGSHPDYIITDNDGDMDTASATASAGLTTSADAEELSRKLAAALLPDRASEPPTGGSRGIAAGGRSLQPATGNPAAPQTVSSATMRETLVPSSAILLSQSPSGGSPPTHGTPTHGPPNHGAHPTVSSRHLLVLTITADGKVWKWETVVPRLEPRSYLPSAEAILAGGQ